MFWKLTSMYGVLSWSWSLYSLQQTWNENFGFIISTFIFSGIYLEIKQKQINNVKKKWNCPNSTVSATMLFASCQTEGWHFPRRAKLTVICDNSSTLVLGTTLPEGLSCTTTDTQEGTRRKDQHLGSGGSLFFFIYLFLDLFSEWLGFTRASYAPVALQR